MAARTKRRMVMTILDSNTIIYLSKKLISLDNVFVDDEEYAISVITYMEVLGYAFTSKEEEDFIKELLSYLEIIYIDENIAKKVINIKQTNKVKLPDAIIAATAILNNATLITNDIRLKVIADLKIMIIGMEC